MDAIQPGIHPGISNDEYHSAVGLSFTGLKEFCKTPAHYQAYLRAEDTDSPSRRLGRAVHCRVLEPKRFSVSYGQVGDRRTKEGKAAVALAEEHGIELLSESEWEKVHFMAGAILNHGKAAQILRDGEAESSAFATIDGILRKCRPDYFRRIEGIVADLKFFQSDLSTFELERQIFRMKYHWQSAWYLDVLSEIVGEPLRHFVHIFVGDCDPWPVRVVELNDAALEKARFEYQPHLELFRECLEKNEWPCYGEEIEELGLPSYAW